MPSRLILRPSAGYCLPAKHCAFISLAGNGERQIRAANRLVRTGSRFRHFVARGSHLVPRRIGDVAGTNVQEASFLI